ncbi:hypothetical protein [Mycobacterium sp. 1245805.9]|uniref:hypothetical protein n=1 Tax=Mycobacterium sp. 1245805.9 TaxID=1856862 RepID=UPI0007FF92F7|nr:hypothetical protein [Mycobacterium sp. 1245805.9]OBI85491.1 hypothetical protein A9X00_27610 [Mycobacterium sp. 1245805.9]
MGVVRIVGLGVAFTAVVTVGTACTVTTTTSSSSSSSSKPTSSTTTSSSATSTTSSTPSGVAPLGDYTYLLLQASDIGPDAATTAPPVQNPGGIAGAGVTYANPDRTRSIDDLVVVFTDPATAAQQAKERASSYGKYVTGTPQPFEVGTNGLIAVGTSPDNSKSVTYVTFAEGRVGVDLEFDSAPNDPAPRDVVLDMARRQDQLVKDRLPA